MNTRERNKENIHTLRHSSATHLLEHGTDLGYVQHLLGHKNSKTPIHFFKTAGQATEIYRHITHTAKNKIVSPLDNLDIEIDNIEKKNDE